MGLYYPTSTDVRSGTTAVPAGPTAQAHSRGCEAGNESRITNLVSLVAILAPTTCNGPAFNSPWLVGRESRTGYTAVCTKRLNLHTALLQHVSQHSRRRYRQAYGCTCSAPLCLVRLWWCHVSLLVPATHAPLNVISCATLVSARPDFDGLGPAPRSRRSVRTYH